MVGVALKATTGRGFTDTSRVSVPVQLLTSVTVTATVPLSVAVKVPSLASPGAVLADQS